MLSTEKEEVLSDEQAKEVVRLLTPDKELPPLPLEEAASSSPTKEPLVPTSDIGSSIESSFSHVQPQPPTKHVNDAVGMLDSLVYNKQGGKYGSPFFIKKTMFFMILRPCRSSNQHATDSKIAFFRKNRGA